MDEDDTPIDQAAKLINFPSYNWAFGCSAVSGAMMAGYYDRNSYPNMYAGQDQRLAALCRL